MAPVLFEPPSWAVPAKGETILEPVLNSVGRQGPVDLTRQSVFRIGRSPHCDITLNNAMSSRIHAMLFHHSNGHCYIVDCHSASGTYVDGVKLLPPGKGKIVPYRVRRGAMLRFGGPGAPSFVLKSFQFRLSQLVQVKRRDEQLIHESMSFSSSDEEESLEEAEALEDHQVYLRYKQARHNAHLNALGASSLAQIHNRKRPAPLPLLQRHDFEAPSWKKRRVCVHEDDEEAHAAVAEESERAFGDDNYQWSVWDPPMDAAPPSPLILTHRRTRRVRFAQEW